MSEEWKIARYRGSWCAYRRFDGKSERRSLGTKDRALAKARFDQFLAILESEPRADPLFRTIWERYRKHLGERPAATTMLYEAKAVLPHFGELPADDITPETCREYITARREAGRKDGTIRTEMNRVRAALAWARTAGLIERVPEIPRPPPPPARTAHLSRSEAARLIEHIQAPHALLFVRLAIATAARASALFQLRWEQVDLAGRLIYLAPPGLHERAKGRAIVPINDTLLEALLDAHRRRVGDFVIERAGRPIKSVKKALIAASGRAGLPHVHAHMLRHTAAVWMAEAGVPLWEVSQYLGHSSTAVTERVYARFSPAYLRKAAASLDI